MRVAPDLADPSKLDWFGLKVVTISGSHSLPHSHNFTKQTSRLESPTRDLEIKAPKELKLESRGGNIQTLAQNDITFRSEIGALRLESSSIIVPELPTAKVTHRPIASRNFDVFQLCVCETGRLFLADPHVVCASENEDGLCR